MPIQWNGYDAGLAPGFASLVTSVIGPLAATYTVQQGYRTNTQQDAAFSLGRNAAGQIVNAAQVVTNARGGQSPHNYGLAVDVYPIVAGAVDYGFSGGQSEPSAQALPAWTALWNAVRASGILQTGADISLASGYDPGHIELDNWQLFEHTAIPSDVTRVTVPTVPTNPDGTPTYDGQPYVAWDESNPYNWNPLNPDGSSTYNGLPYDPADPNNPYTLAGGLPPGVGGGSANGLTLSTPVLLMGAAVLAIAFMLWTSVRRGTG